MRTAATALLLSAVVASAGTGVSSAAAPDRTPVAPAAGGRTSLAQATDLTTTSSTSTATADPRQDPDLEPGWPADVYTIGGHYNPGARIHALVGSIDDDPRLEVLTSGLAAGPLHAYHSDGTPVRGWPKQDGIWTSYPALGDLSPTSGRGFDVVAGWWQTHDGGSPVVALRGDGEPLPGWPREAGNGSATPPVVTDIDGDGTDEAIVETGSSRLVVLDARGKEVPWWSNFPLFSDQRTPAVADLDGDGRKEVVVVGANGTSTDRDSGMAVYGSDGAALPGWPLVFTDTLFTNSSDTAYPVVGDVTGDGLPEVVVAMSQYRSRTGVLKIVDPRTRSVRTVLLRGGVGELPSAALADLDGDRVLDVVVQTDGALEVRRGDGTSVTGFPVTYGRGLAEEWALNSSPVVGDLDGDGRPEIAFTSYSWYDTKVSSVYVYRSDGTPHPRFPKPLGAGPNSTPAIADLDRDGRNELVAVGFTTEAGVSGLNGNLWVWDVATGPTAPAPWGQYRGGPRHEGVPGARTEPPPLPPATAGSGPARIVHDLTGGSSEPQQLTPFAGGIAFTARTPEAGRELWWSDGTSSGTRLLADLRPGAASSGVRELTVVADVLHVVADDGVHGAEPWRITAAGTASLLRDVRPGARGSRAEELTAQGTRLWFSADDGARGQELWRSDGTAASTVRVTDLNEGPFHSSPRGLTVGDGALHVAAFGPNGPDDLGTLWRSVQPDGTVRDGQYVFYDPSPVPLATAATHYATIDRVGTMTTSCDPDPYGSAQLKEALAVGPVPVSAGRTNLYRGCDPVLPNLDGDSRQPQHLVTDGSTVWFTALSDEGGRELWRSDLTAGGSRQLVDLQAGTSSSDPSDLVLHGPDLLVTASTAGRGREPWLVDRVSGAARAVQDIAQGTVGSEPRELTPVPGGTYFTADDGAHGRELWFLPLTATPPPAPLPALSVGDAWVPEGDAGVTTAVLPLRLEAPSAETVTVAYRTTSGTAGTADHRSSSGTVSFPPGTTSRSVSLTVLGDSLDEPAEAFGLELTAPQGAVLGDAVGSVTVVDDDAGPRLRVSDVRLWEGRTGSALAHFTVRLSAPAADEVSVDYATADATATGGADYAPKTGRLTFRPGELVRTVAVAVQADTVDEEHETLRLVLSGPAGPATVADGSGTATVLDDDPASDSTPELRIGDLTLPEGNAGSTTGTVTVRLSAPAAATVTVDYALTAGTAGSGDFSTRTGTLTIAAGATSAAVPVTVRGDALDEPAESFTATLSAASGARLADASGSVTIVDDDSAPRLSVSDVAVVEGDSGSGSAPLTVRLSAPATADVTVDYATADGSAVAGRDYTAGTGTLVFTPGQISKTVTVTTAGGTGAEADESFSVDLSAATGAAVRDGKGRATLRNDD